MIGQCGQNRGGSGYFVTDAHTRHGIHRQVHVHARTKTDKAVALTTRRLMSDADIAQNTTGDQSGHLHGSHDLTVCGVQHQRIALVLLGGFGQIGVEKLAAIVWPTERVHCSSVR